ncbi:hypothetical protein G6O67_008642 [Ophiocordyceps sinensis]|uniref:Tetratricopeptide SHNi-TPR domain-containing protein n=1 Tax=Ophiocordyceps sinensis TaxID=72228 RepID=A0A8H4LRM0_9HYPO|nr:hypothetical protein G6O67_008642 [Ophiocordyceps sinensis]
MAAAADQTRPADTDDELKAADASPAAAASTSSQPVAADDDQDIKSKRVTLADLSAKGSALYAHKNYEEAADIFSLASVLQAEMNGELDPDNAEILFHYGRSLFKVGQCKSDVFGCPVAADKRAAEERAAEERAAEERAAEERAADKRAVARSNSPSGKHYPPHFIPPEARIRGKGGKRGSSAVAAQDRQPASVDAQDQQPASVDSKDQQPASVDSKDQQPASVDAQDQQPASVDEAEGAKPHVAKEAAAGADAGAKKPLFQFTGDENFDNSDAEDEDHAADDESQGEEDDDMATAFEILDLARVCYLKKLEKLSLETQSAKGKELEQQDSPMVRHVKERMADTHDCLAEISLENEQYLNAVEDGRVSLQYKMELYPEDSEIVAEAHYKLSLALEFASMTTSGDDGANTKRKVTDQGLRDEAIREMYLAIKSFKLKMQGKEVELATMASPEDNDLARIAIAEMKEVVWDMEQRLVDLRKDPIDVDALSGIPVNQPPSAEAQARADEAAKNATDLTGMVRKKTKDAAPNGKRKVEGLLAAADEAAAVADEDAPASPKKPRLADGDAGDEA